MVTAAIAVGFLASGGMVWQSSRAAFDVVTDNQGNSWSSGRVSLSNGGFSSTVFNATGLKAGSSGSACVDVNYDGTVDASIKLYLVGTDLNGPLAPYVNFTVAAGTAGCGDLAPIYSGTLAGFAAAAGDFAGGAGSWRPAGRSGAKRGYLFTWTLRDDNAAQGLATTAKFTWEAQSA